MRARRTTSSRSTRADLDVTDDAAVAAAMDRAKPDAIVNGAAYNDVDAAEDHPVEALERERVRGPHAGAGGARRTARRSCTTAAISCSTARASAPYTETDRPSPRSVYAASKLLGEWFALDAPARLRAARREPVRPRARRRAGEGQRRRHPEDAAGRRRRRECSRTGRSRRPTSSTRPARRARLLESAAPPACITASTPDAAPGSSSRRSSRGSSASRSGGRLVPVRMSDMNAQGGAAAVSVRCRTTSCDRSASTCRPGRTRSAGTWPRSGR